jgi:hypothetical protein
MISFKQNTTLTIIEEFDEKHEEIIAQSEETFKAGERVDADVTTQDGPFCELQFADGCVAFAVERDSFFILDQKEPASMTAEEVKGLTNSKHQLH